MSSILMEIDPHLQQIATAEPPTDRKRLLVPGDMQLAARVRPYVRRNRSTSDGSAG
jgi:hypothetical protein